jgi:urea transport system substrate-binding protein
MLISRRDAVRGMLGAGIGLAGSTTLAGHQAMAADEIAVGSILDATGPINIYGLPMIDATKFAIDAINEAGGVLGRKLSLLQTDCQSNNQVYAQNAVKLILENKVPVLMGGITSASREAVRPVVDKYPTVYFYNEQYEGGVCDRFCFCTGVVPTQQLDPLVRYALSNFGKNVYSIAADYNYGHLSIDWVNKLLNDNGGNNVGVEFIPLDVSEFGATINKIQAANPDVLMSLTVGANHQGFYRQWKAAGMKDKVPIVSPTFGIGQDQIVLDPSEAAGVIVCLPYFQELDTPTNRDFVSRWRARFGADYSYIIDSVDAVWTGWHLWAMGVNQAGSLENEKVIGALESGLEFDAPSGHVRLDGPSHHVWHSVSLAKANTSRGFDILQTLPIIPPGFEMSVCHLQQTPDTSEQFSP